MSAALQGFSDIMADQTLDSLAPAFTSIEDYVKQLGGDRPINKLLIANNGIAAVKVIRLVPRKRITLDAHYISFQGIFAGGHMKSLQMKRLLSSS